MPLVRRLIDDVMNAVDALREIYTPAMARAAGRRSNAFQQTDQNRQTDRQTEGQSGIVPKSLRLRGMALTRGGAG